MEVQAYPPQMRQGCVGEGRVSEDTPHLPNRDLCRHERKRCRVCLTHLGLLQLR